MRVVIINRSDNLGGAAVGARRLVHALADAGVDARMLVLNQSTDDALVANYKQGIPDKVNFLAERLQIFLQNGFSRANLFKVDTASWGSDIASHEWVREADVIMLHWINQGALSLDAIKRLGELGKPIVWAMHDMWNATGICHVPYDCSRYKSECGSCVYLKSSSSCDLSTKVQAKKRALYDSMPRLHFVAVSRYLANACRESSLLSNRHISVIYNAFPVDAFPCQRIGSSDSTVLVMGAARLDDEVKGLDLLIAATKHIAATKPQLAAKLKLVLFGSIRNAELLNQIAIPYEYLGSISDAKRVSKIYRGADVVLSTSRYETFGLTLIEGQSSGCKAVTFGIGGRAEIVDHRHNGYIADALSAESFADGIEWAACEATISRQELHDEVRRRYSSEIVAKQHIDLFEELLKNH